MIGFIKKIKALWAISDRLMFIETEIKELESRFSQGINEYSKHFEKKIQQMTIDYNKDIADKNNEYSKQFSDKIKKMSFDYTNNLDDTKSDYLKCYVEQRLNCMQHEISQIPFRIENVKNTIHSRLEQLEDKKQN